MSVQPTATAASTLEHALSMIEPLACWLIRSGVGYAEFATALKTVFFDEANKEAQRIGQKPTDSAISLLAGMHRKDINALRLAKEHDVPKHRLVRKSISMSSQVLGRWLAKEWPHSIPVQDAPISFDALVRAISNDKHPRSVLQELERLGAVRVEDNQVHLLKQAFVPEASTMEAHDIFAANIADHLAAGVHNLTQTNNSGAANISSNEAQFIEQSVFADELTEASTQKLRQLSAHAWQQIMHRILEQAILLNEQDADQPEATHRFRVGLYAYATQDHTQKDDSQ